MANVVLVSLPETTAEIETATVAAIDDALDPQAIVLQDLHAGILRLIHIHQVETIERVKEKTGILVENHGTIEHGTGTAVIGGTAGTEDR